MIKQFDTELCTYKLKKELHYYPSWYKDQNIFFKLLKQSIFTDNDIIKFGRIYTKYNHLKHLRELNKYFDHILCKMNFRKSEALLVKTKQIYSKQNKHNLANKKSKISNFI